MSTHRPEASPLGKAVAYAEHYDPALLFPIPRQGKRAEIGLALAEPTLPLVDYVRSLGAGDAALSGLTLAPIVDHDTVLPLGQRLRDGAHRDTALLIGSAANEFPGATAVLLQGLRRFAQGSDWFDARARDGRGHVDAAVAFEHGGHHQIHGDAVGDVARDEDDPGLPVRPEQLRRDRP